MVMLSTLWWVILISSCLRLLFGFGEEKEGAAERQVPTEVQEIQKIPIRNVGVYGIDVYWIITADQQKVLVFFPFNS